VYLACSFNEVQTLSWTDGEVIVSMALASLGLAATSGVTSVFWKHNNTPVVKSSTRELSYIILVGIALAYAATFALVAKPTPISCAAASILPGVAFALVYGALVTKTNRIARILAGSKKKIITRKLRFMSATAQVLCFSNCIQNWTMRPSTRWTDVIDYCSNRKPI